MKRKYIIYGLMLLLASCSQVVPTPRPTPSPPPTNIVVLTPISLPTFTPAPLDDPELLQIKQWLKEGLENGDAAPLEKTISFIKWVAAIYREGGTPPIDPRRGLNLSLQFAEENKLELDLERPTHEPRWSVPGGEVAVLTRVTPTEGEPYYAHLYIQHEPSAWRYTGILTRIPYYDSPSVAQVLADPAGHEEKEYMYVGAYQPKTSPPTDAGAPPENAEFALETFSGPLWVKMLDASYVGRPPADADSRAGDLVRVYGKIRLQNGVPYLESDSVQFIEPDSWDHVNGTVEKVDSAMRLVTVKPNGAGPSTLKLSNTSFISRADGSRGTLDDIKVGQTVDATGLPLENGNLLVEELFLAN